MLNRVGQQLGNYRLLSLLGRGAFAEVYLGEHVLLNNKAAIKILHTQVTPEDMAKFQGEARLLASLRHPHIVRTFDFGIEGQTPYLVMDYAPNGTLHYRKGTLLPVPTVVGYVKQIADALQYAHDRNVVHRDIKPANMLIGENHEVLLSDFGIALVTQTSHYQSTKDVAGTFDYIAPEQIQGHPRSASDQYSLGIIVYEWLTGTRPFQGSWREIIGQHMFTTPPSLREKIPTLSADINRVVMVALAKEPEKRFPNVKAFARAFEQAAKSMEARSSNYPRQSAASSSPPTELPIGMGQSSLREPSTSFRPPRNQEITLPKTKLSGTQTSRRTFVIAGTIAGASILVIGGLAYYITSQGGLISTGPTATPTPTPMPSGSTIATYQGYSGSIYTVAWSPDGAHIAFAGDDKTVRLGDTKGNISLTYKSHTAPVKSVAWSPDGKRIASAGDDTTVQVWNANDGSHLQTYTGHTSTVTSVAWSPNGRYIASASKDQKVHIWDTSTEENSPLRIYRGHNSEVWSVTWSPDGTKLASACGGQAGDHEVHVWDANSTRFLHNYTGHAGWVRAVAWSPDGKYIASGGDENNNDHTVQVWNANDAHPLLTYSHHSASVRSVAWSPDSQHIASASWDNTVHIWSIDAGNRLHTYTGHATPVTSVAWSPKSNQIASASQEIRIAEAIQNATVKVWQGL